MHEFEFTLPYGYQDEYGDLHQVGRMRLATARDEIEVWQTLQTSNQAYLPIILMSRVVTALGTLPAHLLGPNLFENLYAADMAYLSELYLQLNSPPEVRMG